MSNQPIAIVGLSALFPGSQDEEGFWRDIVAGKDLITDVPARRWLIEDHYDPDPRAEDKTYCKRGAFLSPCSFDPLEFGVPPNAIPATDTCQLLSLVVAKRVLDDVARGQGGEIDHDRTSVILGVTSGQQLFLEVTSRMGRPIWVKALRESGIAEDRVKEICDRIAAEYVPWQENTFPGMLGNVVAGRIANRFDLHGTNCVTDAACASSLAAVSMAVDELRLGRSDMVITGGADTFNDVSMFVAFSKTPALSPTGDCRPFSDRADGTVLGEGIAMFALKRLSDAERDGNHIYAVIRAIGSSSDGRSKSIYAPLPAGQARAMQRAYHQAGYGPESIELLEAHGTGTGAGDAAEIESLKTVFQPASKGDLQWCALGSVKSQVGHTKAAAGAAALFKAAMALHHRTLPPTIKVDRPNPALNLEESPFYINTSARPWIPRQGPARRAALSSFGFGGTNFHAVLEEYSGPNPRPPQIWPNGPELVLLSARDPAGLRKLCLETGERCTAKAAPLANIALASQLAFDETKPHRVAAVALDVQEMSRKLKSLADNQPSPCIAGKIAFLFPGQGSQYLNMGAELAMTFPSAMAVWEKAPETASKVFPPPSFSADAEKEHSKQLRATEWAQPSVGAASAALLALLNALEVHPDCVAGHSFGEISALYASGAIDLETMLAIARRRGELMRDASSEPAGMLSMHANWGQIRETLAGLAVTPANHNGPQQIVLSGALGPLKEAGQRLHSAGFAATPLPVSTAFHSPLMQPAADAFGDYLRQLPITSPAVAFYSNRDGGPHSLEGQAIAADVARQISAPVFFGEMIERMYADGVRTFVEVGPRDILTSLVRSILENREHQTIPLDRLGHGGLRSLWEALGALAVSGVRMNWENFRAAHAVPTLLAPAAEPKFSVAIDGGNYARPYPPAGGAEALPRPVLNAQHPIAPAATNSSDAYRVFQESITAAHHDWQANLAKGHEAFLRTMEAFSSSTGVKIPEHLPAALTVVQTLNPIAPVVPPPATSSREMLWEIVAEKTGYPADMLEPEMALEGDLGIDSIKRVEIFSALQDRFPGIAIMDQSSIASLHTLADIVAALDGTASSPEPLVQKESSRTVLWQVVAEKTGYPVDMLEPEMALEADLGIDSIKRVEIFSALQDRFPALADMEQTGIASLHTLADIVSALDGAPASAQPLADLPKRYIVKARSAPSSGHGGISPGNRVIIGGDAGLASALANALHERRITASVGEQSTDADTWISLHRSQWDAVLFAKAAASCSTFITLEDSSQPWSGGLSGLVKTAALEWPKTRVRAIRMNYEGRSPEDLAKVLIEELLGGGTDREIEIAADGTRLAPELIEIEWESGASKSFPLNPVIVVTGGARGVTAACVKELATVLHPRLVLFGRTPLAEEPAATKSSTDLGSIQSALLASYSTVTRPSPLELKTKAMEILAAREVRENIAAMEHAGATVRYFAIDARDSNAVGDALAAVRREWGPIQGIIHGAGVLADRLIADLTREQFDQVFSTKADALRVLLNQTAQDPLALLCVFSSIAARYGNRGQAAYAVANEVLNRVAETESQRRGESCVVRSINWGPWEGGMVTTALARHFAEMNVPLIGIAQGARAFVQEMLSGGSSVEVVIGGPAPPQDFQVHIGQATHAHLDHHRIQNVPVLPLVEAVGLLLRAAGQRRKPQSIYCTDVKVLRGVRLEGFHNGGNFLSVRQCGENTFELVSPEGTRHYEASLWPQANTPGVPVDPGPLDTAPWHETEIYGHLLFHGPEFHLIHQIEGVSEQGIAGTLRSRNGEHWRHGEGGYDAGMLDGGLQFARLWGFLKLGHPTLPMRVSSIHILGDPGSAPIECRLSGTAGANRIVCDISFFSPEKQLVALMTGVEMYASGEHEPAQ